MTLITDSRPLHRVAYLPSFHYRLAALLHQAGNWLLRAAAERNRRRTANLLQGLPFDIRKDIGWPADDATDRNRT